MMRIKREVSDLYIQFAVGGLLETVLRALGDAVLALLLLWGLSSLSAGWTSGLAGLLHLAAAGFVLLAVGCAGTRLKKGRKLQHSAMATAFAVVGAIVFPAAGPPLSRFYAALFIFFTMYLGYRASFRLPRRRA